MREVFYFYEVKYGIIFLKKELIELNVQVTSKPAVERIQLGLTELES